MGERQSIHGWLTTSYVLAALSSTSDGPDRHTRRLSRSSGEYEPVTEPFIGSPSPRALQTRTIPTKHCDHPGRPEIRLLGSTTATRTSTPPALEGCRAALVHLLQDAHAGELAAAHAYRGHWRSIRHDSAVRAAIARVEQAEWNHRSLVTALLEELGARPRIRREVVMWMVGRFFGLLCFVTFHFPSMYAAGRLEALSVAQYDLAGLHARRLGLRHVVGVLRSIREEEARHEMFFANQCRGHRLLPIARRLGGWDPTGRPADPKLPRQPSLPLR
jgi:hypothetical protein